jgi:hypothetical protein
MADTWGGKGLYDGYNDEYDDAWDDGGGDKDEAAMARRTRMVALQATQFHDEWGDSVADDENVHTVAPGSDAHLDSRRQSGRGEGGRAPAGRHTAEERHRTARCGASEPRGGQGQAGRGHGQGLHRQGTPSCGGLAAG